MKKSGFYYVLLFILLARVAAAAGEVSFKESNIEFDGATHDRILADFNGDGKTDIGVQYTRTDKEDTHFFYIFYQKANGAFGPEPDVSLTLPSDAKIFDAGDVAESPGDELVLLLENGMSFYEKSGKAFGGLKPLFQARSLITGSEKSRPLYQKFAWELNGAKFDEIIFPGEKGPAIYRKGEGGYELQQKLNLPVEISYRVGGFGDIMTTDDINQFLLFQKYGKRVTANVSIPDIFVSDANGDGRVDIMGLLNNKLRVFLQNEEGSFPEKPSARFERDILSTEEKKLSFAGQGMTFTDLNGDNILDIIMTKWGSTENRSQMTRHVYYGKKGLKFSQDPDQIISSASAAVDFGVYDLNNDGKRDLLIPYFHFAPSTAFKVMTENAVKIQFRIYLMGPEGRFAQDEGKQYARPDVRKIINYKIDVIGIILDFQTLIEGKFHPLINFGNDFNGDGYPDLVADTGADKIEFYWGNKDVNYSRQPDQVVPVESAVVYDIEDLNRDGKADIVNFYESEERVKEKRKIAQDAYRSGSLDVAPEVEAGALLATKEQTRIKVLLSQ